MKIVVFAGVFDPVHKGHISAVKKALKTSGADKAVIVAEKVPQHKHGNVSYQHRHRMLTLAVSQEDNIEVLEAPTTEHLIRPFFTWLNRKYPEATFSWLVGSDVIGYMHLWPDIEKLTELSIDQILVAERTDFDTTQMLSSVAGVSVSYFKDSTYGNLSSIKIRMKEIDAEESLHPLVLAYIRKYQLYEL